MEDSHFISRPNSDVLQCGFIRKQTKISISVKPVEWATNSYTCNIHSKSVRDFSAKGSRSQVPATDQDYLLAPWRDCPKYGPMPDMAGGGVGTEDRGSQLLTVNPGSTTHSLGGLEQPSRCLPKLQSPPHRAVLRIQ